MNNNEDLISIKTEKNQWIKLKCNECRSGAIYVLPSWKNTPRYCDFCKARRVDKKERALRSYFKNLRNKKRLTEEDQKELLEIVKIEEKLEQLKKIYGDNERIVFEELILIKKVREILFNWDKQLRKSRAGGRRHKCNFGADKGNKFNGFVQGGSPGLKK